MSRNVRNIALAVFFLCMLGSVFHIIGSGIGTVGMLLAAIVLLGHYLTSRFSPKAQAARQQADVTRGATIAEVAPEGSCLIYVYRERSAPALIVQAGMDMSTLVDLSGMAFTRWVVKPGSHVVRANIKGTNLTSTNVPGEAVCNLAAGESAFFQVTSKMGITKYTVTVARDVDADMARNKLAQMTMVEAPIF